MPKVKYEPIELSITKEEVKKLLELPPGKFKKIKDSLYNNDDYLDPIDRETLKTMTAMSKALKDPVYKKKIEQFIKEIRKESNGETQGERITIKQYNGIKMLATLIYQYAPKDIVAAMLKTQSVFFRGMNSIKQGIGYSPVVIGNSRLNRQPLDTSEFVHKLSDFWFTKNKFIANRSNSILMTSSKQTASDYGEVSIIIPLPGSSLTWSKEICDFTNNFSHEFYTDIEAFINGYRYTNNSDEDFYYINKTKFPSALRNDCHNNFKAYMNLYNYVKLPNTDKKAASIVKKLLAHNEKIYTNAKWIKDDPKGALWSGNETMLAGKFLAINLYLGSDGNIDFSKHILNELRLLGKK